MRWVASRKTTIKEDKAYCFLGIFGVFMPLLYGEGEEHASARLREDTMGRAELQFRKHIEKPAPAISGAWFQDLL
jgi:hypothetical protein